jgi:hypothetical protein
MTSSDKICTSKSKANLLKHFWDNLQRFVADPSYETVSLTIIFKKSISKKSAGYQDIF